ncbi:LysR family transcriptional regulator [Cohnella sp. CBP 2801]|uniref:LysR family transcriptional regulator n=1 Tax=Cohnella zeiphila TaxID=2761120 RepID=A0A7X0ST45_9BACL|nr:LysR family transcriptional regulator [Cohnella zeiphila]
MEIRQLEYFSAVCEELHFSRAAEKLGISQPNLSLQIKALEQEIGAPLFDRLGKRIALTSAGELLRKHCCNLFTDLDNAYEEIRDLCEHQTGNLAIGMIPSELDYRLTPILIDFHHRHPNTRLRIYSSVDVAKLVLETEVDIGISLIPDPDERLTVVPLGRQEYGLVVSAAHELADRESILLEELKGYPIIMYPKGFWGRELVEKECAKIGFRLNTVVETTSNPSLFRFVAENVGATVQTATLTKAVGDPKLRFIPIRDRPPARETCILHRSDKYLNRAARAFIETMEEQLKERSQR